MTEDEDRFDAIVVGAGPAGSACAYTLAKAGKSVLMIERGTTPGEKNMTGGRLYTYALEELEPGFTLQATEALERRVVHESMMLLDRDRAVRIDFCNPEFDAEGEVPHSYTVLRASFDAWLASQAEDAGAMLVPGIRVDELIEENGKIVGVKAGEDEMYADIIIAADGVNSLLGQKAGLVGDVDVRHVCVGAKEVIELPEKTIEERFSCAPGQGTACLTVGGARGVNGGTFIYTNKSSISFGCVLLPEVLAAKRYSIADAIQEVKQHPLIASLLADGKTIEYSAHLCPEAGLKAVPKTLWREGFCLVGDAAGFVINQGFTVRGMDLAILSGLACARACLESGASTEVGAAYARQLEAVGVMRAMRMAKRFPDVEDNPRIFSVYPELANAVFNTVYEIDHASTVPLFKRLKETLRASTGYGALLKDGRQILSSLRVGGGKQ